MNFEQQFRDRVVDYFVREYGRGRTPNPCLACNEHIKYRALLDRALALDADFLATGHYARVRKTAEGFQLLRAADDSKDQSYVLYTLGQAELARLLLPIGGLEKSAVRAIATRRGLTVADKPDSNEICFVPNNDYRTFLHDYAGITPRAGALVDVATDAVVGAHDGYTGYTVGQRKGLGAFGAPRYVVGIRPESNVVLIGDDRALMRQTAYAERLSWVAGTPPPNGSRIEAKIRYKSRPAGATLTFDGMRAVVQFDSPQRAITPGQSVVFYDGDVVLGGGTIEDSAA